MNADDKAKTLRWLAKETEFAFAAEELNGTADLIESLQSQLSESQRRERAAVEDIMCRDHCDVCISGKEHDGECKTADYNCLICKSTTCMCRECRNEDHWKWRGRAGRGGRTE